MVTIEQYFPARFIAEMIEEGRIKPREAERPQSGNVVSLASHRAARAAKLPAGSYRGGDAA